MNGFSIAAALCLLAGCVSETSKVHPAAQVAADNGALPQEVLRVPQQMQDVAGDLLRYHAKFQTLPPSMQAMVQDKVMSPERFAALPDYLYSPGDRYTLPGKRVVILVDAEVCIEGHAWCIVREPSANRQTIQLNVTPVSLNELEAAARKTR